MAIAALSSLGIVICAYLTVVHFTHLLDPSSASVCNFGGWFDCDVVNTSEKSEIFGIPVAFIGFLFYVVFVALALQAMVRKERRAKNLGYLRLLSLFSVVVSIYLGLVSATVIRAFCVFCLVLYGVNLSLFVLVFRIRKARTRWIRVLDQDVRKIMTHPRQRRFAFVALGFVMGSFVLIGYLNKSIRSSMAAESRQIASVGKKQIGAIKGQDYGPKEPAITVFLFSDFECSFCEKASFTFKKLIDKYEDRVRFVFKHYPLDPSCNPSISTRGHRNACRAARAAVCAAQKGRFDTFHQEVFNHGADREGIVMAANNSGLDPDELLRCAESIRVDLMVKAEVEDGLLLGVKSTPTYVIGNHVLPGARKEEELTRKIDALLMLSADGKIAAR